jgi:hypothetical protein
VNDKVIHAKALKTESLADGISGGVWADENYREYGLKKVTIRSGRGQKGKDVERFASVRQE